MSDYRLNSKMSNFGNKQQSLTHSLKNIAQHVGL